VVGIENEERELRRGENGKRGGLEQV
jgi:hypothetical protein